MPGKGYSQLRLFLLAAVVVYVLLKRQGESRPIEVPKETPLEIVKRRYAKGELTKEEYEEMKKELSAEAHDLAGGWSVFRSRGIPEANGSKRWRCGYSRRSRP